MEETLFLLSSSRISKVLMTDLMGKNETNLSSSICPRILINVDDTISELFHTVKCSKLFFAEISNNNYSLSYF